MSEDEKKTIQIVGDLPAGCIVTIRKALTERQREGMRRVLRKLASATCARWDQHLRDEIPDADADEVIAWLKAELNALPEGKTHCPDCEANRVGVGGDGLCDMSCGNDKDGEESEPPDWGMFL